MEIEKDFEDMTPEEQFRSIWAEYMKNRPAAPAMLMRLEDAGFFEAPASSKHHLAEPGGLVIHTLHVVKNVLALLELEEYRAVVDEREAVRAALLHDICKAWSYAPAEYGRDRYVFRDTVMLGHGEESVILAMRTIALTENETLAIRWHMGAYEGKESWDTLGRVYKACPLALLLHQADMMATYLDEK